MRKLIMALLLVMFIVSGGVIIMHFYEEHTMERNSAQARDILERMDASPAAHMDFEQIRAYFDNDDIVAHLSIEGTNIDYLVVQGGDNEFYLTHDIWSRPTPAGWIFLDYEADITRPDHNWIIYGHNMQREHKFHSLRRYADRDFFHEHPNIVLTTPLGKSYWEIFSFYSTPIYFAYNIINFVNPATMEYMLNHFVRMSRHDAGIDGWRREYDIDTFDLYQSRC